MIWKHFVCSSHCVCRIIIFILFLLLWLLFLLYGSFPFFFFRFFVSLTGTFTWFSLSLFSLISNSCLCSGMVTVLAKTNLIYKPAFSTVFKRFPYNTLHFTTHYSAAPLYRFVNVVSSTIILFFFIGTGLGFTYHQQLYFIFSDWARSSAQLPPISFFFSLVPIFVVSTVFFFYFPVLAEVRVTSSFR